MEILFIPSIEKGNGTGHIKRCIKNVLESTEKTYLLLPEDFGSNKKSYIDISGFLLPMKKRNLVCRSIDRKYDVIITDKRETSAEDFKLYKEMSEILIGLDEGGICRKEYPYLIDTLPSLSDYKPNIFSTGLLGIKDKRKNFLLQDKDRCKSIKKILITFGGEDPENLTEIMLSLFSKDSFYKNFSVQAVKGPLFGERLGDETEFEIIESPESLEKYIDETDLVITSFGITAYEALYAGKPVLLVNPSDYHSRLSAAAGIPEIGIKKADEKLLKKYLESPKLINEKTSASAEPFMDLNRVISALKKSGIERCPFCRSINHTLTRFPDRNYYRCRCSSVIYMERFTDDKTEYGKDYFFDDYRKQYGRTYLEDFENIKKMSDERVRIIKKYKKKGSVLDIGCAYGPFLKSAAEAGFDSHGIDISGDAVEYVKNILNIEAVKCDFSNPDVIPEKKYDAVTMWYVIEHFKKPDEIIEKVKSILNQGGIFAFSSPDLSGISGKTDIDKTLYNSPDDHYTFWSMKSASKILEKMGFRILEIRNTGHHPERFSQKIKNILPEAVLKQVSFLLKLGDTFEIYAEKK